MRAIDSFPEVGRKGLATRLSWPLCEVSPRYLVFSLTHAEKEKEERNREKKDYFFLILFYTFQIPDTKTRKRKMGIVSRDAVMHLKALIDQGQIIFTLISFFWLSHLFFFFFPFLIF